MSDLGIRWLIGTGGIGHGTVLRVHGNQNIQREESRGVIRLKCRDFCKLHIIFHYASVLSKECGLERRVIPVGAVGGDDAGKELLSMMKGSGMDLRHVRVFKDDATLFSICFQFPDGSGGNLTSRDSAGHSISRAMIHGVRAILQRARQRGMVLAVPEVPLERRFELIRMGARWGAKVFASFTSGEMREMLQSGVIRDVDVLSINRDEAAALSGLGSSAGSERVVRACAAKLLKANPRMHFFVTLGKKGVYGCSSRFQVKLGVLPVKAVNPAGAGDAFMAGLLLSHMKGLPFLAPGGGEGLRLARLLSAMSTLSMDTIHFGMHRSSVRLFARKHGENDLAGIL